MHSVKRREKAYRVPSGGKNWYSEYVSEGRYNFKNVHVGVVQLKKSPKTSILGNLDWFILIIELFKAGASQVNVFGTQFHSSDEYIAYVDDTSNGFYVYDLLTEERLRGLDVLGDYGWREPLKKETGVEVRSINQSELSCECWSVQFRGLKACDECEFKGKRDCGGKNIIKTGKNEKGYSVPLGEPVK